MGRAKDAMIKAEERGWDELDTFVCADCVEDGFLKSLIQDAAEADTCDYCGEESDAPLAAPATVLQEAIASAVFTYFNDPSDAGVTWDEGSPIVKCLGTADVLMSVGLECHEGLRKDIEEYFTICDWVPAAGGHWVSSHPHEEMSHLWDRFAAMVKEETRFFFMEQKPRGLKYFQALAYESPHLIFSKLGALIDEASLLTQLPAGTELYRVREFGEIRPWDLVPDQLGPPPAANTSAGRMNPAGIRYFYLAEEPETALAEVLGRPPCSCALATFRTAVDIPLIDFTNIQLPSIFDEKLRDLREGLLFLDYFVGEIRKPIYKDGREHIEYLPSQVVSEYLAKVYESPSGQAALGMIYPSAVQAGGRNVVLFPFDRSHDDWTHLVRFEAVAELKITSWAELTRLLATESGGSMP